jgi:hypothetical protein
MTFTPVLPGTGYAGWIFLQRTKSAQAEVFNTSPEIARDEAYFREKIKSVKTADDLVADRRLLKVALGAYGLEADINSTAFIRKVLSDGTLKEGALSGRLADKQYEKLAAGFGFGDFSVPNTQLSDFPDKIITLYRARSFEVAVGTQNNDFRLSLSAERELAELSAATTSSEDTKWFKILGSAPLRQVFQTAFGLPSSIGGADLDKQLQSFKAQADKLFGSDTVSQFTDTARVDTLVRRFLVRSEAESLGTGAGSGALVLQMLQQSSAFLRANRL